MMANEKKEQETNAINYDVIVKNCNKFTNLLVNMFKKPITTLKNELKNCSYKKTFILLAILAVTFGLSMTSGFKSLMLYFGNQIQLSLSGDIKLPYFKIFIYMTIIFYILVLITSIIPFVVSRFIGNKEFDYKKSVSLYVTSMIPAICSNLIMFLLFLVNILSWLGVIIAVIVNFICFVNYLIVLGDNIKVGENKKGYLLSTIIILMSIVMALSSTLLYYSLAKDISKDIINGGNIELNKNSFNW